MLQQPRKCSHIIQTICTLRVFIVHICVKALFLELLWLFYILIPNVTDVDCALIHYVPFIVMLLFWGFPAERICCPARKEQREQRGVRARADWLLRYLRSVAADGVFLLLKLPPQTAIVPDASTEARFELE